MRKIENLGMWCQRMLKISMVAYAAIIGALIYEYTGGMGFTGANDGLDFAILSVLIIGLFQLLATYIMCGRWIVRAAHNAAIMSPSSLDRIGPGWALGWYFIPIANLWKPFQAMRQIWNSSVEATADIDAKAPTLLTWWWTLWVISTLISSFSSSVENDSTQAALIADAITLPVTLLCTYFFLQIVQRVTDAQTRDNIADTFA